MKTQVVGNLLIVDQVDRNQTLSHDGPILVLKSVGQQASLKSNNGSVVVLGDIASGAILQANSGKEPLSEAEPSGVQSILAYLVEKEISIPKMLRDQPPKAASIFIKGHADADVQLYAQGNLHLSSSDNNLIARCLCHAKLGHIGAEAQIHCGKSASFASLGARSNLTAATYIMGRNVGDHCTVSCDASSLKPPHCLTLDQGFIDIRTVGNSSKIFATNDLRIRISAGNFLTARSQRAGIQAKSVGFCPSLSSKACIKIDNYQNAQPKFEDRRWTLGLPQQGIFKEQEQNYMPIPRRGFFGQRKAHGSCPI